jgi:hypothetical protein
MHSKKVIIAGVSSLLAVILGVASFGTFAQSYVGSPAPLVTGLNSPRHLTFDADGNLYVAESGTGGEYDIQGPFGPAKAGGSSSVTQVMVDGSTGDFLFGLPSTDALNGEVLGASKVIVTEDSLWLLLGQGALDNPFSYTLLELSTENKRILQHIDLYTYESENNPDGAEIDSNPVDFVVSPDGVIYIADAGANTVYSWTEEDGLSVFVTWEDNPVPSSVEVGIDGSIFVGFLTSFPFPTGGARVEQYDEEGELTETYEGFTGVVDLLFANDTLYAVEIGQFGEQGWVPASGRVVDVFSGDAYYENLNFPYSLNTNSEGNLFLSVGAAYSGAGGGQVLSLDGVGLDGGELPPVPVTTPDVTEAPTSEVTDEPATSEPTDEATEEPTDEVTEEPTDEVTEEPTEEPTDEVTEEPTDEVTEEPTSEITPTDEVEPTDEVTATEPPVETEEPTEEPAP